VEAVVNNTKRVCLLTGASGVLGRAFCERYRDEYEIVAVYRSDRPWIPSQDARIIDPFDPSAPQPANDDAIFAVRADLLKTGEARRVVELALSRYDRVDLVVNAAVSTVWAPMLGSDRLADSVADQFALAVEVPLRICAAAAELCWQGRAQENRDLNRNVVNVSSIAALQFFPNLGQSVYAASKAAMDQLTVHMASEFASLGVRVNATAANSFPALVSVERAVRAIHDLDQGADTATTIVVDGAEDRRIPLDHTRSAVS
jgi:NAD(P)-dependent dehydrogenase (short-subunit alcohol dehydrogenase family)